MGRGVLSSLIYMSIVYFRGGMGHPLLIRCMEVLGLRMEMLAIVQITLVNGRIFLPPSNKPRKMKRK